MGFFCNSLTSFDKSSILGVAGCLFLCSLFLFYFIYFILFLSSSLSFFLSPLLFPLFFILFYFLMQEESFSGQALQGFSIPIQGRVGARIPCARTCHRSHPWGGVFADGFEPSGPKSFFQGVLCYWGCDVVFATRQPFSPLSFLFSFFFFPWFFPLPSSG